MDYPLDELKKYLTDAATEFYELAYNDDWFKKIFRNIKQEIITSQQVDFMVAAFGGPRIYNGRMPKDAHPQVWVDEDMWQYREDLLKKAFNKVGTPQDIQEKWLKIDHAFKSSIVNTGGVEQCKGRWNTEEIIYEPMPDYIKSKFKKAA